MPSISELFKTLSLQIKKNKVKIPKNKQHLKKIEDNNKAINNGAVNEKY